MAPRAATAKKRAKTPAKRQPKKLTIHPQTEVPGADATVPTQPYPVMAAREPETPPAGETIEIRERVYVGQWGKEYVCEVLNILDPKEGIVWNVILNGDERRFINGGRVQLSEGHIEILNRATIDDTLPIKETSPFYFNKAEAERHNPGMTYKIINGLPHLVRKRRRYVVSILRPAEAAPLVHGGMV